MKCYCRQSGQFTVLWERMQSEVQTLQLANAGLSLQRVRGHCAGGPQVPDSSMKSPCPSSVTEQALHKPHYHYWCAEKEEGTSSESSLQGNPGHFHLCPKPSDPPSSMAACCKTAPAEAPACQGGCARRSLASSRYDQGTRVLLPCLDTVPGTGHEPALSFPSRGMEGDGGLVWWLM